MLKENTYRKGNNTCATHGECYHESHSMTAQNQAFTIEQLFLMHAKGTPVSVQMRQPVYNGDNFIPDPKSLDLVDAQHLISEQMATVSEKKTRLADLQKKEAERKSEAEIQKRVNEQLAKQQTPP